MDQIAAGPAACKNFGSQPHTFPCMASSHGLRKKFLILCSTLNPCKGSGCMNKDGAEEPALMLSEQKLEIHERGYHMAARRGPRLPGLGKGPPPQTS
ncbi:unnamed protein product [Victoria cruziana]